jgi:hypothetical protein
MHAYTHIAVHALASMVWCDDSEVPHACKGNIVVACYKLCRILMGLSSVKRASTVSSMYVEDCTGGVCVQQVPVINNRPLLQQCRACSHPCLHIVLAMCSELVNMCSVVVVRYHDSASSLCLLFPVSCLHIYPEY